MTGTTPAQLTETLQHLHSHWERRRAAAAQRWDTLPPGDVFTIALAREAGTQGTLIAREVGKRLGWQVYDHELLERIAVDMGLRTALLESMDERRQSWLLEAAKTFLSAPAKGDWGQVVTESAYVHFLIKVILALGVHGECVIVGRGASFILPAKTTLRVRLIGPVRDRIATWSRNLGISEREAARQVRTIDRERADFVQDHFFKDPADQRNYDLIFNVARFSVAMSADVIVEAVRQLARK